MATLPSNPTSTPSAQRDADAHGATLWWLWLVSDQATIGTQRRARTEARQQAAAQSAAETGPAAAAARSWSFADLALESK